MMLEEVGLFNKLSEDKFVPEVYLRSSRQQRLEMLAGLMDTDGHMTKSGFDFYIKIASAIL